MPRPRDYAAEYRRRVERGTARGLTASQARGHPKRGEPLASNVGRVPKATAGINDAIKMMRHGASLRGAADKAGVPEKRLRRFLKLNNMATRTGRTWRIYDRRPRRVPLYSQGALREVVTDLKNAAEAGRAWSATGRFRNDQNPDHLRPLAGRGVTDIDGRFHPFETDPNAIYRIASAYDEAFHEIYQIQ